MRWRVLALILCSLLLLTSWGQGVTLAPASVAAASCPCSIWPASASPTNANINDGSALELGVKFRSDVAGYITGVRFYKGTQNTGTHTGSLWSSSGQRLATATFTGETASGWQQVTFSSPVAITANTTYVASYFDPTGVHAETDGAFASAGVDAAPLHALQDGVDGGNGLYLFTSTSAFPTQTYQSANYWVDVTFVTSLGPDTTPPTVTGQTPAPNATGVALTSSVTATFNEALDPTTVTGSTVQLRGPNNTLVAATVSYASATLTATLMPSAPLATFTTYTATLVGGSTDPRIKDVAGNALAANITWSFTTGAASPCTAPANPIVAENCLPGNPASEWDVNGEGDTSIQGYATDISVNRGTTVSFKVKTNASAYRLDIYRLGYYGGMGARKVATVQPSASLPQNQPACLTNASTRLVDCGNWAVSASWAVPATATSGIYIARLVRSDTGGASHIIFIVRDDASHSNLLFQTSDETWQAYNSYGGYSLYGTTSNDFDINNRAYKVSYNRPFRTRSVENGVSWVFNAEYPMVRWLEANGYDVTYFTGVDSSRFGNLILNHKVFMSVGHDEYWAGQQRANIEAARNAGINLAFFSGNTMFWKTRWENSIDGSNTTYRTLVCYKETEADAKIDPSSEWTGTWRDPRFSPPSDGGRPENAVKGTAFMVNGPRIPPDSIQVPAADGKMRFWRNTSIANLAAGQTVTLAAGTLGFEWDVDLDNGFRPAGLVHMSTATVNISSDYLVDYGTTFGAGTAVHSLTLYRHASGALVFDAGTIQWSWGLDANHDAPDYAAPPADVRMQQATVNLLADMLVQPATLQAGLVTATASTDTTAPTSVITSPAAGGGIAPGANVTITGTATDAGGGVVGGVEVSVDGGATWHPATGRGSWTYSWKAPSSGTVTLKSRAVDDSGNLETPGAGVTVTIGGSDTTPPTVTGQTPAPNATGVGLTSNVTVTFSEALDPNTVNGNTVQLRGPNNTLVAATVSYNAANRTATLTPTAALAASTTYTATVVGGTTDPRIKDVAGNALAATVTWSFTTAAADTTPPTVTGQSPAPNATGVATGTTVTATFSENLDPTTVNTNTVQLRGPNNTLVTATVSYDAASRTATLTPSAALAASTTYTATLVGGATDPRLKDLAGNALAANVTWSFTTAAPSSCPCSIWPASASPANANINDGSALELGVKFRSDVAGYITGVRFYKGTQNTGTHTGSLWSSSGQRLATVTFTGESASGWQQVTFASPVAIAANTTYVASYFDPTGVHAETSSGFATAGVDAAPLHALQDGADGGNGVYLFTSASAFPTQTYQATNYWVDVVFVSSLGPDTTPPTVTGQTPAPNATGVAPSTTVTATFSEAIDPTTVTGSTVQLRGPNNTLVAATVSYNTGTLTATLTPSAALAASTTYTVTLVGGSTDPRIKDVAGNALAANVTWSFTTAAAGACPCTIWPASATPADANVNDGSALELGVKFRSDVAGYITGIRFYKGTQNTGTHTGSLWTRGGQRLATATFTGETASGWQQVTFATPVAISANTTYVASYFDPTGMHAETSSGFNSAGVDTPPLHALRTGVDGGNGVYRFTSTSAFPNQTYQATNYWVDVVFVTTLGAAPVPAPATASAQGLASSVVLTPTMALAERRRGWLARAA